MCNTNYNIQKQTAQLIGLCLSLTHSRTKYIFFGLLNLTLIKRLKKLVNLFLALQGSNESFFTLVKITGKYWVIFHSSENSLCVYVCYMWNYEAEHSFMSNRTTLWHDCRCSPKVQLNSQKGLSHSPVNN